MKKKPEGNGYKGKEEILGEGKYERKMEKKQGNRERKEGK